MEAVKGMNMMLIHVAASTLNREEEGIEVVGRVAAMYLRGGNQLMWDEWWIGTELTQFDADAYMCSDFIMHLLPSFQLTGECKSSYAGPLRTMTWKGTHWPGQGHPWFVDRI
jgi:hypothetical protein